MVLFPEIDSKVDGETEAIKEEAHRFAKEQLRPASIEIDKMTSEDYQQRVSDINSSPWWRVMKQAKKLGYNKILIPESLGGPDLTPLERWVIAEELAWGGSGFALSLGTDGSPLLWAILAGKMELTEELVRKMDKSDEQGCWAATEPTHGSNCMAVGTEYFFDDKIGGLGCKATIEGDEVVINGAKSAWVSTAPCSTHCALNVNMSDGKTLSETTGSVYVPYPYEGGNGMEKGKPLVKIGHRDNPQGELFFNDYRIPKDYVLVNPEIHGNSMMQLVQSVFTAFVSVGMAYTWIGHARACFEEALKYVTGREQGGKLLWKHQLTQQKLYDMYERIITARTFSRKCFEHIWQKLGEQKFDEIDHSAISVMQVYSKRAAYEVSNMAVQLHGANGITKDYVVEKLFRDTRPALIEDTTPEIFSIIAGNDIIKRYKT